MSLLHGVQLLQQQVQQQRAVKRQRTKDSFDKPRAVEIPTHTSQPAQDAPTDIAKAITGTSDVALAQSISGNADRPRKIRLSGSDEAGFYGNARLSEVEIAIQRFLAGVHQRLQKPDFPVKNFPRQADAFQYADEQDGGTARVFSVEISASSGARSYSVASYERFWRHYNKTAAGRKHHYEIIREQSPCHLYFDLEFDRGGNPSSDGNQLTDELLEAIAAALLDQFDLKLEIRDAESVTELDSTTDIKWSRHLIVRIPGAAFATSKDCGAFVSSVLESTKSCFSVFRKGGGTTSFVDCSVYSRNRAFRLYLSSKAGRSAVLNLSGRLGGSDGDTQRAIFMRALICNVDPQCRLLYCTRPTPCDGSTVCGVARSGTSHTSFRHSLPEGSQVLRQPPCSHPGVDSFFSQLRAPDGVCGQIRNWAEVGRDVLLVSMRGTRWCGNVGRHHKSNGIYYVVDLAGGTWWQKCYDYDCRSYRSEMRPLPPQICSEAARLRANEGVLAEEELTSEEVADALAAERQAVLQYARSTGGF